MRVAQASIRGTVEPVVGPCSLRGWVEASTSSVVGTVDRTAIEQVDAETLVLGARVMLDGHDVTRDLQGEIELSSDLDDPVTQASFSLHGPEYLPHRTTRTWTRTPCEIAFRQGPPGDVGEALRLQGVVDTCNSHHRGVRVRAAGQAVLWREAKACHLEEPLQGLTRGQILRRAAEALGISLTCPDGAVYDKGLELVDEPFLTWAQEFARPEGWRLREHEGGLQAWCPRLKTAPQPPDYVWHLRDLLSPPTIDPPETLDSTWVVRGDRTVVVDEDGQETEIQTVEVQAWYTPRQAVQMQQQDGTLDDLNLESVPRFTTVSRVITETTRLGSQVLRQVVSEWGWHNPLAGRRTSSRLPASAQDEAGYSYIGGVYIDADGRSVSEPVETFRLVGRRETEPRYGADGTRLGQRTRTWRWNGRRRAVRNAGSVDEEENPVLDVENAIVADDSQSYWKAGARGRWQRFELAEDVDQAVAYGADGHQVGETSEIWGWHSPKATTDPEAATYVLANGDGMRDSTDTWSRIETQQKTQSVRDGAVDSETQVREGYIDLRADHGPWSWGTGASPVPVQPWGVAEVRQTTYTRLSEHHYQKSTWSTDAPKAPRPFRANPPSPCGKSPPGTWCASLWSYCCTTKPWPSGSASAPASCKANTSRAKRKRCASWSTTSTTCSPTRSRSSVPPPRPRWVTPSCSSTRARTWCAAAWWPPCASAGPCGHPGPPPPTP